MVRARRGSESVPCRQGARLCRGQKGKVSLTSHIPTRPHTMDEGGDGRLPQEVPSVALDQLFLDIHDHLPRDARGKLAQLADEMKKLTEANTADVWQAMSNKIRQRLRLWLKRRVTVKTL